jgi:diacylglycerol O-acyltransferase
MKYETRMSDSDALMWTIEKDPMLRSTITAVLILDSTPDHHRIRTLMDRGTRLVPRMRQRVRGNPLSIAPPRWEVDPNFDLDFHLRFVRAGGDRSLRTVLDLAQPIAMQGFDRSRPLWEALVVDDLVDGKAAMIMKIHHAITDGLGAVKIALVMFELERQAIEPDMPEAPEIHVMNQRERFLDALEHERRRNLGIAKRSAGTAVGALANVASAPPEAMKRAAETAQSVGRMLAPATRPLSPVMTGRSLSVHFDTVTVSLPDTKQAARAAGGKLNDAFLAATAAGLRRYHEAVGQPTEALRMSMPVSIRDESTSELAGNQFVPLRFPIPLNITEPVAAMHAMHELVVEQRAEPAVALVDPLARILNRLPTSVSTGIFGSMLRGIDVVASNVPGSPFPIYTAGSQIEAMFAFGPMTGAAVNFTLISYIDELLIGVNVDPAAVTEPDLFVACYQEGWDEVLKVGVDAG